MKEVKIRHKNIDLVWQGGLNLRKEKDFLPMKLSYNKTAGWWITRRDFFSTRQLRTELKLITNK